MDNFAAADQLLDTAASFPIAFQKSNILRPGRKMGPSLLGPAVQAS
jgi:hypothetical protein